MSSTDANSPPRRPGARGSRRISSAFRSDGTVGAEARTQLADFVRFSLALYELDGRKLASTPAWRSRVAPDFVRFPIGRHRRRRGAHTTCGFRAFQSRPV